jgi:hypothetical protein
MAFNSPIHHWSVEMRQKPNFARRTKPKSLRLLLLLPLIAFMMIRLNSQPAQASPSPSQAEESIEGPFFGKTVEPHVFNGSLLDLPVSDEPVTFQPKPLRYTPGQTPKGASTIILNWDDPVAQDEPVAGLMPDPIFTFPGISNYSQPARSWPPDTNGDVGPNHYVQTVNTSIGIYNKNTGALIRQITFNDFFLDFGTACDNGHSGDPVVVYDRFAQRWVISDFKVYDNGPYYECVAVSQTSDPVGGWYYYDIRISTTSLNDYPKLGVWRDSYFFTFNMFSNFGTTWGGVQVWALEKARMLAGQSITPVYFSLNADTGYSSLLPAHALSLPPMGAPNYLASVEQPGSVLIWEFTPNWLNPGASTFTGPIELNVAPFALAASIPQPVTSNVLDSLSYRPMMQLIYRMVNGIESLWLTHTVASGGVAGMRWYEVRQPGTAPVVHQQGTYQPDDHHRWMGSLSVDQDGNMALGYSIGSRTLYPSIRYTGRLADETAGLLPQGEKTMFTGTTYQSSYTRWGDYSAMAVDPTDDCTFYYTTEYYLSGVVNSNVNWQTGVGAFKYPSCGQPKGRIHGAVRDSISNLPIPGVQVVADSATQKMTVTSDSTGFYTITLAADTFSLTAGPLLPGYPESYTINNVPLTAGITTEQDLYLGPVPNLVSDGQTVDDNVPTANNNGYAEPGESDLNLWTAIENNGALDSTNVTAQLTSLTSGVTVGTDTVQFPDIASGQTEIALAPFSFSVDRSVVCGTDLLFLATVTDTLKTYTLNYSVVAAIPLPRRDLINHTVENGAEGWTTVGSPQVWQITNSTSNSPTQSWTDSPAGDYANYTTSYLYSPVLSTWHMNKLRLSFWTRYELEAGYDYVFLDYTTDGGQTWSDDSDALATLNGVQTEWQQITLDIPELQDVSQLAFRFRLLTDSSVTFDGVYVDDIVISFEPYTCEYGMELSGYLPLVYR